jgi:DNA (cytosine-5)-methyltransferase 1
MANELLYAAPIWDDIKTLRGSDFNGAIDIIYGGFPCQDISIAGHGKGLDGERSGLFFEIMRLAKEIEPKFIFLENVPAITSRGGLQVVREIASMGYDCRWCTISASSVGALHKRNRWFLLAYSKGKQNSWRLNRAFFESKKRGKGIHSTIGNSGDDGNTLRKSSQQTDKIPESLPNERRAWGGSSRLHWTYESVEHWQKTVSEMGKCSDGIPNHVDRLRALGNAVVPEQAKQAFKILIGGPC